MKSPDHIVLGKYGEKLARISLLNKGYILLERNYFNNNLEVDIIAEKDNEVVFVEVKTRKNKNLFGPEDPVDRNKEENLLEISENYMVLNQLDLSYRIDIISIIINESSFSINHFENAGEYFLID